MFCCCCFNKKKALEDKLFMGKLLDIKQAGSPDDINWDNLGYSPLNRTLRYLLVLLVSLALICFTFETNI